VNYLKRSIAPSNPREREKGGRSGEGRERERERGDLQKHFTALIGKNEYEAFYFFK